MESNNPLHYYKRLRDRQKQLGENTLISIGCGLAFVPTSAYIHPALGVSSAGVALFSTIVNALEYDRAVVLAGEQEDKAVNELYSDLSSL